MYFVRVDNVRLNDAGKPFGMAGSWPVSRIGLARC
jgi:hypothetical protein